MKGIRLFVIVLASWSATIFTAETALAVLTTNYWILPGSGFWSSGANWSGGAPAGDQAFILITNGTSKVVTIDTNSTLATLTISNLIVRGVTSSSTTNTLRLVDTAVTFRELRVLGDTEIGSNAVMTITNSIFRPDPEEESFGGDFYVHGVMNFDSGTLAANNMSLTTAVGVNGSKGVFNMKNGTLLSRFFITGLGAGSSGTSTFAGGESVFSGQFTAAFSANSTGTVWMTGGEMVSPMVFIGRSGTGQMTVSNGTLRSSSLIVGQSATGRGTLTIAGGIVINTNSFVIGDVGFATGSVTMASGNLTITNSTQNALLTVGRQGRGVFTMTGGNVIADQILVTNVGSSSFNIIQNGSMTVRRIIVNNGGNFTVGNPAGNVGTLTVLGAGTSTFASGLSIGSGMASAGNGTVWLKGGELLVPSNTTVGVSGLGSMTASNGTSRFGQMFVGNTINRCGTLTVAGGDMHVRSNLFVGGAMCSITGTVWVVGGNLFVTNNTTTANLEVRGGTLTHQGGLLKIDRLVVTNECARFISNGGTLVVNTSPLLAGSFDADGDGMNNSFELGFGFDPFNPADASQDADGDGANNLEESIAGTHPLDNHSYFRIISVQRQATNILVTWAGPASGHTNMLQVAAPANGSFTNNFVDLPPAIIFPSGGGEQIITNRVHINGAEGSPARYYRIRVVP